MNSNESSSSGHMNLNSKEPSRSPGTLKETTLVEDNNSSNSNEPEQPPLPGTTSADVTNSLTSSEERERKDIVSSLSSVVSEELEEKSDSGGEKLLLDLHKNAATHNEEDDKSNNESLDVDKDTPAYQRDSAKEESNKYEDSVIEENKNSELSNKQKPDLIPATKSKVGEETKDTENLEQQKKSVSPADLSFKQKRSDLGTILSKNIREKRKTQQSEPSKPIQSDQDKLVEDFTMPGVEAIHCPKGIMRDLADPMFDVWRLDRDSMVDHIEYMYHDLGIVRAWNLPRTTLRMFLLGVRERYQDNPYHNFKHCFCVTQMAYSMICKLRLRNLISVDFLGALLTAAVCHDVDHPGLSNAYHSHARTPLAILYNYQSILEQHHFAVACRILSNKESNIFRNVSNRDEVLTNVGELILATDLAMHKDIMEDYTNTLVLGFDFKNSIHVMRLLKMIIKCADVSNEVRPETVASPWVERLFAEYSEQSAREKRERLPVTSYMDPDLVNIAESQEGFIRGVMLPMYDTLCKLVVEARVYYVNPIYEALMRYEDQNMRDQV